MIRWQYKKPYQPIAGDFRIVRKFHFLPTRIGGEVRWLGLSRVKQEAYEGIAFVPDSRITYKVIRWANVAWVDPAPIY